jgi:nucleotide-binding universal stress UspA family protein
VSTWVVGVDGSEASIDALRFAAQRAVPISARLAVVHARHVPVMWTEAPVPEGVADEALRALAEVARNRSAEALEGSGVAWEFIVRDGRPADVLDQEAVGIGAELIVVSGREHSNMHKRFLGSVSTELVHAGSVSVLVVR